MIENSADRSNAAQWRLCTLQAVAAPVKNALVGGPFGSDLVSRDYMPSGVPVIRGTNMGHGRWVHGEFVYVSPEKADSLASNCAKRGDLIFTQRGTLGQVALVPNNGADRYLISQSQMKLTVDAEKADALFLYYVFTSEEQQAYIRLNAIQTGVPHTNLGILRSTPILLPPLADQLAIAALLGSLDDKIELNRRMNGTLEAMARAIFKSWFIDFDPVRAKAAGADSKLPKPIADLFADSFQQSELGEVPKGWEFKSLDQIATFLNGLALQKFPPQGDRSLPVIKIAQMRAGNTVGADRASADLEAKYVVNDGDVLFSWSGSLECVLWAGGAGALNQHLFKVTSVEYPKWFYYLWIHTHLDDFRHIAAGKATTMGHIQRHHLTDAKVVVASTLIMELATKHLGPLIDSIPLRTVQSRTLAAVRDALLPKLISGEIRIKDAERIVGRAV